MNIKSLIFSSSFFLVSISASGNNGEIFQVGFADVDNYTLPYYAVATSAPAIPGSNIGRVPHRLLPLAANISKKESKELAIYYFPDVGIFLAPKGWIPNGVPSIGADGNGSAYLFGVGGWLRFDRIPACAGCAYFSARTHLPWVKPNTNFGPPPSYKPFTGQKEVRISNRITAIRYSSISGGNVNGVIQYGSANGTMDAYDGAWFYAPKMSHKIATVILNFIIRYDIDNNFYIAKE